MNRRQATVLVLGGSPRRGGATDSLVDEVVHGIEEAGARAVRFLVADHAVGGCIACEGCYSTGVCVIRDDMDVFLESMDGCDALVVVTPVYFSGVPSQLKAVYDRLECRWAARYLLGAPRPEARPVHLLVHGTGADPFGFAPAATESASALAMPGFRPLVTHDFVGFGTADSADSEAMRRRARDVGRTSAVEAGAQS